jgi:hypothetical protein
MTLLPLSVVYEPGCEPPDLMRRATAGSVHSFVRKRCIDVVSCGFAATSADRLGAGGVSEVKCLFAINSITAVYRADWAKALRCKRRRNNSAEGELNKTREQTSVSILSRYLSTA